MSEQLVPRYDVTGSDAGMTPTHHGDYVCYDDFAKLERELAAEKAKAMEAIALWQEAESAALAQVATLREALDCLLIGACAVGVPHKGEREVLQDAVAIARAALASTPETKHPDTERLDWLDEYMSYHGGGNGGVYSFRTPADVECGMLREAIDAARKAHP